MSALYHRFSLACTNPANPRDFKRKFMQNCTTPVA